MKSRNLGFENSLRCLQHPLTLSCIAILLINDHLLKLSSPSWLTGKLSDFAGLFFFPFLFTAVLSILLIKFNRSNLYIGQIAFVSTGIWFFLFKTYLPVNTVTKVILSFLMGHPVQLIPDQTDTFALIMLWPAWALWNQPAGLRSRGVAYFALTMGALACLATSPVAPPTIITSLVYKDGAVYAVDNLSSGAVLKSLDEGATWEYCWTDCRDIWNSASVRGMPIQVCDPEEPSDCYRITGGNSVEVSKDNGKSWSTGWEIPPDRRGFVEREGSIPTPRDMIIMSDGNRYLLVAMGNDGIIRRHLPTGKWERIAVYNAQPTPYAATDFGESLPIVWREIALSMAIAAVALIIAGALIWRRFPAKGIGTLDFSDWALLTIVLVPIISIGPMVALFIFGAIILWVFSGLVGLSIWMQSPYLTIIVIYASLFLFLRYRILKWLTKLIQDGSVRFRLAIICLLMVTGVSIVGALPWPLWALGIISKYQTTQIVAFAITTMIIAGGCFLIYNTKPLSPKGNTNLPTVD